MTTSFTRTRLQLATMVMGKLGVTIGGATAASADAELVYESIDLWLKEAHKLGIFWRKVTKVPVLFSLSASIATCSAGAGDILFPIKATFRNNGNDEPLEIIGRKEYAAIPEKDYVGDPTKIMWTESTEFVLWPVPRADGTAHLLYEKIADDTTHGSAPDVDVAMLRSVRDIICYDLADNYAVPEQRQVRWQKEAQYAERKIRALSAERVDYAAVAVEDWGPNEATGIRRDWRTG
jgi:hypothetical protein